MGKVTLARGPVNDVLGTGLGVGFKNGLRFGLGLELQVAKAGEKKKKKQCLCSEILAQHQKSAQPISGSISQCSIQEMA